MLHFYTPLKTSENRRISDIFRGYKSGTLVENGLIFGRSQGASNKVIGQKWAKPLKEWNRPYLNEIPLRVHLWFE